VWNGMSGRLAVRGKPCKQYGGRSGRCSRPVNLAARRKLSVETLEDRMLLAGDTLVITELMAINGRTLADEDGDFEDWVEIYNPTDAAVDLDGWFLTDDSDRLNRWRLPAVTMEPGDYEVVFASKKDRTGAELHTDFKLDGDGEFLALVEPDGTTIASEFRPEFPEQTSDVSFGLASNLETKGYFLLPTPGAPNVGDPIDDPTRQIVISEIMYHPASNDSREEYIELLNLGANRVDLTGWKIDKGVQFEFPAMSLGAGERLVVAADLLSFQTKYEDVPNVVGGWTGQLSNQSEAIAIEDASGKRIDRVEYADGGEWSVRVTDSTIGDWAWSDAHDGGGKSLELINSLMSNNYGQNWRASRTDDGTPGEENSVVADKTAPLILDVMHSPAIPTASDSVTVSARIVDDSTFQPTVIVHFRRDNEGTFRALVMHDDGQSGDGVAGDGIFAAKLPPQADGTVVEFYVQTIDDPRDGSEDRTWPAPAKYMGRDFRKVVSAMYQVEDHPAQSDLPVYRTIMTSDDRDFFASQLGGMQMNATFISSIGGQIEVRYNADVRVRGNGSRNNSPPPNRINLPSDKPWNGVTALNLNSVAPENQVAGAALFTLVGLPAAQAMPVQYLSNGTNLNFGKFYAHVEPLNSDFVAKHFPDDDGGNLYKGLRPSGGLEYLSNDPNAYSSYQKLSNQAEADWSDIINLTFQLNRSPNGTYLEDIAQVVDIDQWLRFFAFNAILGNDEGGLVTGDSRGDDYAMYRGIEEPRFKMVPHDLDSLFGESRFGNGIFRATGVPALERFLQHPDILPRYYAQFADLIEDVTTPEIIEPVLREALGKAVSQDTIDGMLEFLRDRGDEILAMLPEHPDPPIALTIEPTLSLFHGYPFSALAATNLRGEYDPTTTRSVTVNGIPATLDPQSGRWTFKSDQFTKQNVVVPAGSAWRYLDGNDNYPSSQWRFPTFDDSAWRSGEAQLGFGDNDETTVIAGGPVDDRRITTFFRREFQIDDPDKIWDLTARLQRDDGAIVYLNGRDVGRSNMRDIRVKDNTLALSNVSGGDESIWHTLDIDVSKLVAGRNVLAVEVHQSSSTSDDLSFDLSLTATLPTEDGVGDLDPGINRILVEASAADGELLDSETIDIWYKNGIPTPLTGPITDDRTLLAKDGPWRVTEDLIVEEGATLTIEPGTNLYFDEATRLVVRGTLIAEGLPTRRIRFTADPETGPAPDQPDGLMYWGGIHFSGTISDQNRIAHVDIDYAPNSDEVIEDPGEVIEDPGEVIEDPGEVVEDPAPAQLVISEILASNQTVAHEIHPAGDLIELFNASDQAVDLSGMSITDNNDRPEKYIFPVGTTLAAGEYLVLHADDNDMAGGEIHTGFSLKSSGDDVTLFSSDGEELDRIQFGIQADDLSVARLPNGEWGLAIPTFGSANVAQPLGDPHGLKINEWFTAGEYIIDQRVRSDDFVELYNGDSLPVLLGGLFVTDLLDGAPDKHEIAPLSYIGPTDYTVLIADSKPSSGADHLNFRLASDWGWIGLFDQNVEPIDRVLYGEQQPGVSQGREPVGGNEYEFFTQPTPGIDVSPPSVPMNVEIVTRTSTRVELHWSASVDEQSGVAGYRVYRDGELVASTAETSYVDTSVLPGELYRYRVSAIDTIGTESEGSDSIRTLFEIIPPTSLLGMAISRSQIDLTWDAPIAPETPVVEYRIYRDGELIGTGESTSFIDTSFTVGPTISYQISYINEEGFESIRSTPLGFTFLQQGTNNYFGASDSWINANFPEVNYNDPNENYKLEIDGTDPEETLSLMRWDVGRIFANQIVEGVSLTVNVTNRSSEEYEIYAAGRSWNDDEVTWQQAAARVNWQEPGARGVDDRDGDVLGVMLGPNEGELTTPFTAAGVAAVQDWIANPATNYGIIISDDDNFNGLVVDSAEGRQPPLLIISHRSVDGSDVTPPPIPTGLRFEQLTPTVAEIAWDKSVDPEGGSSWYRIFRDGILIGQTNATRFTDTNLSADKHYLYQVSASNSAGLESHRSETLTTDRDLTPPSIPVGLRTTSLAPTEIGLAWDAAIDLDTGVASYTVFRNGVEIGISTITSFRDNTVAPGPPSVYTVSAINDHGTVSEASLPATVIMFQDGVSPNVLYAGTRDTWIDESNPTSTTAGTDTGIEVYGDREDTGQDETSLIKWDLAGHFPLGARVIDTAISLTVTVSGDSTHEVHEFHDARRPWSETEATWLLASSDTPWGFPGAQGEERGNRFAHTGLIIPEGPLTLRGYDTRLDLVQSWIDEPDSNYGLILYPTNDVQDGFTFASRESAEVSNRPIFIVSVLAPGSDTTPPSFAGQMFAQDDGVSQVSLVWSNATDRDTGISHYEIFRDSVLIGTSTTQEFIDKVEYGVTYEYRVRAINGDQMPGELSRPTLHKIDHSDTGYGIQLVAPKTYIPGIPFLVRVNAVDEAGNINRIVNDDVKVRSHTSYVNFNLYSGTGALWLTIDDADANRLETGLDGVSVIKPIVANSKPIREVSGILAMSETWSDVIHVVGDTIVPDGGQLTIMPGTTILIDGTPTPLDENGVDIIVQGSIQALGTAFSPIVFTASEPNTFWGEINHDNAEPSLYQYTHVMQGGHSPRGGHTNSGPVIRSDNSQIIIEDSAIIMNAGKTMQANNSDLVFRDSILAQSVMGLEIADSALLFERNLMNDLSTAWKGNGEHGNDDNDGIFVNGQLPGQVIRVIDNTIRNGGDDAIEIFAADVTIENVQISGFQDNAISVTDGNAIVRDSAISAFIGVSAAAQFGKTASVVMDGVEFVRASIAIQARDEFGNPDAEISFTVSNSILLADDPIQTDYDPADIDITYSTIGEIWPGEGNIINIPRDHSLPRVHRVGIASTEWTPEFSSQFDYGTYQIPDGRDQKKPIPWANLNQLTLHFTTDVELNATDLKIIGLDGTDYTTNLTSFVYSDRYNVATWILSAPLPTDRIELQLSDSVQDRLNFPLDGEWHPREGEYPSGDGQAGGDFIFQFTVLPGDTNQSGRSDLRDAQAIRRALLSKLGDVEYSSMADLDGSGQIGTRDMQILRNWLLRTLPPAANLAMLAATERRRTSSEALFARLATDGDNKWAAWSIKDIDAIVVDNEDWMEVFEHVME